MEDLFVELNQLQAAKYEYQSKHVCNWNENPRPFSTIAIMRKGDGRFLTEVAEIDVKCGDIFFIPAGSRYISYWNGDDGVLYYAIHFHMENRYSEFSPQKFCLQKITPLKTETLISRFETLCKYILTGGVAKLKAYSVFYDLYADVLPLLQREQIFNPSFDNIKNAVEYIEHNSDKEFTVNYLAQMCLLSESRFYALFRKAMGCSPIAYRNNIRIRKAVNLLGEEYNIEEIATKVGFSSAIDFRRIFKKIMGKLPTEYRKNLKFNIDK